MCPSALIASGNIRWYATRASIKGYLGGDDRMALQLYHDEFVDHFDSVGRDLDRASDERQGESAARRWNRRATPSPPAYGTVKEKILDAQKMEITTAEVYMPPLVTSAPRCSSSRTSATAR